MLSPYRVLDLTDERGQLAGFVLAALGAEVIAVEPPAGSAARHHGVHHNGTSLWWWAYNRGKKSVVADAAQVRALVQTADVLLDTGDLWGLTREELAALNPGLVHVTITPFGSTGPKAGWAASDLTVMAAGCQLAITGDADRPPVRTAVPQAFLHAASEAACGALVALLERGRSGRGQHVDVSAQQAIMQAAIPATLAAPLGAGPITRVGGGLTFGAWNLRFVYPAADGSVSITLLFGDTIGRFTARLMQWVHEEGHCDQAMADKDWVDYGTALLTGAESNEGFNAVKAAITSLTSTKTKAELVAEAKRRRLLLAPVATVTDVLSSEQLEARDWWEPVDDPALGRPVRAAGPFARLSATPLRQLDRPPRRGEHQASVLAAASLARRPAVRSTAEPVVDEAALAGLKVLDLSWVYAAPLATRMLGDFGATVVKVESTRRPDPSRGGGPYINGDIGPDGSGQFAHFATNKLGLSLDLGNATGREVLLDLVRWADVLVESYSAGVMDDWGLGWDELRQVNPRLVMLSSCLMGQTGPERRFAGFGNLAGAVTGFYDLTGWADRPPAGPFLAYTDYVSPRFMVASVLAALDWRERSGEGQFIDFSQAESSIHFISPALLEAQLTGYCWSRMGNEDRCAAPHGVYPARGEDSWVAIVCDQDDQWRALAMALGRGDLASLERGERLDRRAELDEAVSAWTATRTPGEAEATLQPLGVAVHGVQNSGECLADPQLIERRHFVAVPHPVHPTTIVEGPRVQLSRTPGHARRAGPTIGENNDHVLRDLLGYSDGRITDVVIAGALE